LRLTSFVTNLQYFLRVGDTLVQDSNTWTIQALETGSILVSGSVAPAATTTAVYRRPEGQVVVQYRVFKSFDTVIKIDSATAIEKYFGTLDDENILAWALKLAFDAMEAPRAIYAIPYKSQAERDEAFKRLENFKEPGVNLIDNVLLDYDPNLLSAASGMTKRLAAPERSRPLRFFVAYDAPPYEYEWMLFNDTIDNLRLLLDDEDENDYYAIGGTGSAINISSVAYNGRVLSFVTDSALNAGTEYIIKIDDTYIRWTAPLSYSAGQTVNITNPQVIYGKLDPVSVANATTTQIYTLKEGFVSDSAWSSGDMVFVYSVAAMTNITDLFSFYTSQLPDNEFINVVNPWVFTRDEQRKPGFYLASLVAGLTIGRVQKTAPTAFVPLPRTYVWRPDYDDVVWGNLADMVIDAGMDMHIVEDDDLISWLGRTSYTGDKIDKRYQYSVRTIIIVNYYQKAILKPFVRRYTLDSVNINLILSALGTLYSRLKRREAGPILGKNSRILKVILVESPEDIPEDIPVNMTSGIIVISVLQVPRPVEEIVAYNIISSEK